MQLRPAEKAAGCDVYRACFADADFPDPAHTRPQLLGRIIQIRFDPEAVHAVVIRCGACDGFDLKRPAFVRQRRQRQCAALTGADGVDIPFINRQHDPVAVERGEFEQHVATRGRGADRAAQVSFDNDPVEWRDQLVADATFHQG